MEARLFRDPCDRYAAAADDLKGSIGPMSITVEQPLAAADADLDEIGVNVSPEPDFQTVLGRRLVRRSFFRGVLGAATVASLGSALPGSRPALAAGSVPAGQDQRLSSLTFPEIQHGPRPDLAVAEGYEARVLIRWGDKVLPGAPEFDPHRQTAAAQAQQFGYNNDFQAFLPLPRGSASSDHGLLWVNHEYPEAQMMFPSLDAKTMGDALTREQVDVTMQSIGGSVVEVRRQDGAWQVVLGPQNRRITATTSMRISGPAAGDTRLRTGADPEGRSVLGMIGNCAGGVTPWGTILTCEENFDTYFSGDATKGPEAAAWKRMGLNGKSNQGWARFHDRFDLAKEPNEPNRFGWVVEIDPYDPDSTPVKRTALGRFKHEAATTALTPEGHVAVYTGDDQRFEYLYRFVSRDRYDPQNREANRDLLDHGTLSVARFGDDGQVEWLPLVFGEGPLTPENGFRSAADVMIDVRRAADLLRATPMDRPEDVEPNPVTGRVYVVLTNNNQRKADQLDKANPRAKNLYGQILEMTPPDRNGKPDHGAARFAWEMFIMAGNPEIEEHHASYGAGVSPSGWFACPDNIAFDGQGRLWIATDQGEQQSANGIGDGIWACDTTGRGRAVTRMFFRTPTGAEMCGPVFTPDSRGFFVAVQHPANDDPTTTYAAPTTRWPDFRDDMPPRPSVVSIVRKDGGVIGS
ncbi:dTDP-glucose 4,6-dehydratase [Roseomonas mucosa]|uniref:dTDP-glucose 4,6-dehydratase n=2 Tax=Roseomonadaceae TaxID=3385906 RepID=A0A4Y1MZP1_9PROT|nr:dTDP-glucose 4,6-dehydratase [Roseomonas mucosa]GAV33125.1 hypothetical protein ROTAS13_00778 [Roseomonas sp. TAS13]